MHQKTNILLYQDRISQGLKNGTLGLKPLCPEANRFCLDVFKDMVPVASKAFTN